MDPLIPLESVKCEIDSDGNGCDYLSDMKVNVHDGILPCTYADDKGKSYNHIIDSNTIDFDPEYFLNEMEKRTAIWDSRTKIYQNRVAKTKAWEELLELFIPEFQDMDITKRRMAAADLQKRWRSLRGCYIRDVRNKKAGKKFKEYKYFQQLSFLEPVCETKIQLDGSTEVLALERNADIRNEKTGKKLKLSFLQPARKIKIKQDAATVVPIEEISNDDLDDQEDKNPSPQTSSFPIDNTKRISFIAEEQKLFKTLTKHIEVKTREIQEVEDADRYYLLSLLPHYKSLTEDAKLEFQMDVLKSLKKWKMQYPPMQIPTGPILYPHTIPLSNGLSSTESCKVFHQQFIILITIPDLQGLREQKL